uniref:TNFR-Cys domain-containing protein n=1 Tax=Eptatretus burgeri TaxID=7764 RepID=A0A8C4NFY5_EPTBU
MDGARRSGVLAIVTLFFVEVSLMSSRPSIIQDDLSGKPDICDPESEYKATKHCCQLCPPGFYLGEECHEPGQESACYPCHINFFMAFKNHARKCHRCKECFGDFEEKAACMPTMNRECRCISGKYQDHDGEICINCTPCTNQNTLQECTESTDTICINADDDQSEKIPKKTAPVGFIMAIVVFLLLIIVLLLVKYLPTLSKRLSIGIFCKKQRGSCSNKEQTEELTELYGVEPSN